MEAHQPWLSTNRQEFVSMRGAAPMSPAKPIAETAEGPGGPTDDERLLHVLICLAAAKVSEPRLAYYQQLPDARVSVIGDQSRASADDLVRLPARRLPYLGAPERWTAALAWFRGLRDLDPGPIDCVMSLELHNPTSLQANHLAARLHVPHVVTIAEILPNNPLYGLPPWAQLSRHQSRSADAFVCSVDLARNLAIAKGCPPDRCVVINPGVDLQSFFPRRGGRTDEPTVLFVGELRPDKGIRDVIRAVKSARRQIPALRLIIAGTGPLRAEVEAEAREDSLIEYRGRIARDQLPALYQEARSFILAPHSRRLWAEQFGFASIEAMASGLPVVITDCGAVREVVPAWNPICGERDVAGLAAGIVAAMGEDGDDWGLRNRAFVLERFEMHTQAAELRAWLHDLVPARR
jgi:glycosyltransferase involved in cell wall biosynthesis